MPTQPPRFSFRPAPPREAWTNNSKAKRKLTGRALQRERKRLFEENPLCVECEKQGRVTPATIRDHTLALAFGGEDVRENTQGLCKDCSDAKTKRESVMGRRRGS